MGLLLWTLKKVYYARVNLFIYVSEKAKELDEKFVRRKIRRYTVIRNLPEREIIKKAASEQVRSEAEPIRICFFGRIRDEKLLADVGEMIERLDGKYRFILAGSGPDAERIARKVKSFRYCQYLGPYTYNQLPTLYKDMDVVCTLYTMDLNTINAVPVKFYEAVALGLPVIAFSGTRLGALCISRGVGIAVNDLADLAGRLGKI
jgi:glycosyltransferase involved in cell wall biosynthesis